MQSFQTQFVLSRDYLAESYDQSLPHGKGARPNYIFPLVSFVAGCALLQFTEQPKVAGIALIAFAVLELLHIRYRRAWWLTRQMWGKGGGSEVTLLVDEVGAETQTEATKTKLLWSEVERVIETDLGLIFVTSNGTQQYLSKSLFSKPQVSEMMAKIQPQN